MSRLLTRSDVIFALGYDPYDAGNPGGYVDLAFFNANLPALAAPKASPHFTGPWQFDADGVILGGLDLQSGLLTLSNQSAILTLGKSGAASTPLLRFLANAAGGVLYDAEFEVNGGVSGVDGKGVVNLRCNGFTINGLSVATGTAAMGTILPLADAAVALVGTSGSFAREDHVHPFPAAPVWPIATVGSDTATGPVLNINGAAGNTRRVRLRTASSDRWTFGANNAAEAGSNAGSDFVVDRYSDGAVGLSLGATFTIKRATGRVLIGTATDDGTNLVQIAGKAAVVDSAASGSTTLTLSATANTGGGAGLKMTGNGATTPSKTMRVLSGIWQIVNNAYSNVILQLTDAGHLLVGQNAFVDDGVNVLQANGAIRAGSGGAAVTPLAGTALQVFNGDTIAARTSLDAVAATASYTTRRANGVTGALTAVTTDDLLGSFQSLGHDGTGFASANRVAVNLHASALWTATSHPTDIRLLTTPTSGTSPTERMRITASGRVLLGTTTDDGTNALQVSGPAAVTATGGVQALTLKNTSVGVGAQISLQGDGVTTPNKIVRARAGALEVVNSANTAIIATMGDDGSLALAGPASVVADPTTALQLTPKQYVDAKPRQRNVVGNPLFRINQRAPGAVSANNTYVVDRWRCLNDAVNGTRTMQQLTMADTDRTAVGDPDARNLVNANVTGSAVSTSYEILATSIEDVRTFQGKTVTYSFWAVAAAACSVAVEVQQNFGSGGSPSAIATGIGVAKFALTTSWARYQATFTMPPTAGKTFGTNNDDNVVIFFWLSGGTGFTTRNNSLGPQTSSVSIWGFQMEQAPAATPVEKLPYVEDLLACRRYYQILSGWNQLNAAGANYLIGVPLPFTSVMRAAPAATLINSTGSVNTTSISVGVLNNLAGYLAGLSVASGAFALQGTAGFNADYI